MHGVASRLQRNTLYDRMSLIVAVMVGALFSPQIAYDISTPISIPFFFLADSTSGSLQMLRVPEAT
jgi:hypothetical protein